MKFDINVQRTSWICAIILDSMWIFLSTQAFASTIVALFIVRLCLDIYALGLTFTKKYTPNQFIRLIAVWIWVLAVAGLMVGNAFLFLLCSVVCVVLYHSAKVEERS